MSFEVQSSEIENHKSHTFTFDRPISQYIVGFSRFFIEYPTSDHHVKTILIDLSDVNHIKVEDCIKVDLG